MTKSYQCGCGTWTGERCHWQGGATKMVVVEHMPMWLRASHEAAGNRGVYPHNGAVRIAVEQSCADELMEDDSDWSAIIGDADPVAYAEEAD